VKGSGTRHLHHARIEFGVDINGRFALEAVDSLLRYGADGALLTRTVHRSIDTARRTNSGAYVQAELRARPRLRMAGGVRADRVWTTNVGGFFGDHSTSTGAFSGFGSMTVGPFSGYSLTGQISRGFRDPTLSDRFFRGPTGRGFITGNPHLRPETSLQFDVAARYTFARTQLAAYAYRYRIDDLVERYSPATDVFLFRNRGRARLGGFELEARTDLGGGVALEGGVHIGRGSALGDDASLDDVSADALFIVARKDFGSRAFSQVRASFTADDDRPGPSEIAAPGARVVDLSAGWRFTRELELRGIVRNLLDEAYYASPDPRWVYAPGRSGSVTLAFQF
jgi:outer membrane receptor protein involved in Fe transport